MSLRVIPVIDLIAGQVVRGVAGRRHEYRPIESILAADALPTTVACALATLGLRDVYIADLDAIGGAEPAWGIYRQIADCGLSLHLDAGLSDSLRTNQLLRFGRSLPAERAVATSQYSAASHTAPNGKHFGKLESIVAGLESLDSPERLEQIALLVGPERLVFSLDLKAGQPMTTAPAWQGLSPLEIAGIALEVGVRRLILLDLSNVGMGTGVGTGPLCRAVRALDERIEIIAGGGVRTVDDLYSLAAAGCDAALVASALHDGRLTAADLQPFL